MNEAVFQRLEYDKLKEKMIGYTVSPAGRLLAERHKPSTNAKQIRAWLNETEEAAALLASGASVPLSAMEGIDPFLALLGKGRIYTEAELDQLLAWLVSIGQMKRYMNNKRMIAPTIAAYADSMNDCPNLRQELDRCIRYGRLTDQASPDLGTIRRHLIVIEDRIHKKLDASLSKYKSALQDPIISRRRGRSVISVKREHRKLVPGTVWDESASGQTLFIEPIDVAELQQEWQEWSAEEERERTIILSRLSDEAEQYKYELLQNREAMASFDFMLARGKLSLSYDGQPVTLSQEPFIKLVEARHPLLGGHAEPLNVELGIGWKQLIITGPNTGGKTVALKTIGLLALLVQSGLLVPASPQSRFGVFNHIMADVGDGQSLEQSLSTFSSHIAVLKEMLHSADERTIILLDELAAGTDPGEGIALSIAVLEELLKRGALTGATTHFNEIKKFASGTTGCMNARMAFDSETLRPLYRLEVGEAGESHAFAIARRFGLPEHVMQRAEKLAEGRVEIRLDETVEEVRADETAVVERQALPERAELPEETNNSKEKTAAPAYSKGDAVWIYPLKRAGIVFQPADERGEVIVQVQGKKMAFNRKRIKPYISREKLYPGADYDMDIVFDTKENRKKRKLMGRKYVEGLTIETKPDATGE
ncbi:dsDNA-specific endonuclease/ATPase MutS2 [Paenibacillus sp. BK033]|uniref:endonuclease MutS2 n=1 Tax=Paenibacillus sp. BK033 TaxID=2512133 RepID=UPI00104CD15D|nr:DNA mismatch repair protein MutS [Paenibacillus sp. BK033]TCN01947.1 dsDNA-specific endonuclease/ATPase MutS2 [Paenibacillus sp. BK033]